MTAIATATTTKKTAAWKKDTGEKAEVQPPKKQAVKKAEEKAEAPSPKKPTKPTVSLPTEEKAEVPSAKKSSAATKSAAPTKDPSTFTFKNVTDKMHQVLPDNGKVLIGKANDARPGSERHAAIEAAQACKTGADLKKIATNWVNWIKKNDYIRFEAVK